MFDRTVASRASRVVLSLVVAALCIGPAVRALASGPGGQTVFPTYDSVVRVLYDAGMGGGVGFMEGTGSVVANTNVNGNGYLWVLTADHVVSSTGTRTGATANGIGFAFGNAPTGSGHSVYYNNQRALGTNVYRGGASGLVDLAVFGVNYGAFNSDLSDLVVDLVPYSNGMAFSEIGYGNQGNLVAGGYQAQYVYGTQRYFNQQVTSVATGFFDSFGYRYPAVRFQIQDPTNPNAPVGSGAALDADSGAPWFSTDHNGTFYAGGQFAILTGITPPPSNGLFSFGSTEFGVGLTAADISWIYSHVPEPGAAAAIIWLATYFSLRRRGGR